jgi:hypothetical protein
MDLRHGICRVAPATSRWHASELVGRSLLNGGAPTPRVLEEIRSDEAWAAERFIDWTKALISVVTVTNAEIGVTAHPAQTGRSTKEIGNGRQAQH